MSIGVMQDANGFDPFVMVVVSNAKDDDVTAFASAPGDMKHE